MYSLRRPPPGLTLLQQLLWPLIFAQLAALKNWVRVHHGYGVPYGYFVSRWGRVTLTHVGARPFTSYSAQVTHAPARFDFSLGLSLVLAPVADNGLVTPDLGVREKSAYVSSIFVSNDTS